MIQRDVNKINKQAILLVADGIDCLDPKFLDQCERAGIFRSQVDDEIWRSNYMNEDGEYVKSFPLFEKSKEGIQRDTEILKGSKETKYIDPVDYYANDNMGHCYFSKPTFKQMFHQLSEEEKNATLKGRTLKEFIGEGLLEADFPIPFFFLIKHNNKRKADSHHWYLRGFCEYM